MSAITIAGKMPAALVLETHQLQSVLEYLLIMAITFKILLSSLIIAFASWLSSKRPALAGFIIALPISSMIAIAFSQLEWRDPEKSTIFAKSILVSIPLSLTFFLPFLFAKRLPLPFWGLYASGVVLLAASYLAHQRFMGEL